MSSHLTHLVCPACREEYRPVVTVCVECHVELVPESSLPPDPASADFPPISELTCVRVAPIAWIRALSEALEQGGIGHRIEAGSADDAPEDQRVEIFGDVDLFALHIMEEHVELAREVDERIAVQVLPAEVASETASAASDCPACGTQVGADEGECPDCGIAFV